jgi:hypothetical protein
VWVYLDVWFSNLLCKYIYKWKTPYLHMLYEYVFGTYNIHRYIHVFPKTMDHCNRDWCPKAGIGLSDSSIHLCNITCSIYVICMQYACGFDQCGRLTHVLCDKNIEYLYSKVVYIVLLEAPIFGRILWLLIENVHNC